MIIKIFRSEATEALSISKKYKIEFMSLLDDIDKNFCYYTSAGAAKFLYVSKGCFSKYFHKMSGMVFVDYLNAVSFTKAIDIIQSNTESRCL